MTFFNVFKPMHKRKDLILISPTVCWQKLRFFWHKTQVEIEKNSGQNFKNSGFRDFPRVPKKEKWWKIKPEHKSEQRKNFCVNFFLKIMIYPYGRLYFSPLFCLGHSWKIPETWVFEILTWVFSISTWVLC